MTWLRTLTARLYDGSVVVGWRIARWPRATAEGGSRLGRCVLLLLIGSVAWRVPWLFAGLWVVAAWRAGPRPAAEQAEQAGPSVEFTAGEVRADLSAELHDTVRRLADGGQGVQLDRVLADWEQRGLVAVDRSLSEFRQMCEQVGVPVRASLKVAGAVRIGIHLADLPDPSLGPAPADQVDG